MAVEDEPAELGLLVWELDGQWALGLRLPEIPNKELVGDALAKLTTAHVDVFIGERRETQLNAIYLRPGVGTARVPVSPSLQPYRTEATGTWPAAVERNRWRLQSRGLEAKGTLFRFRAGEWTRLRAESGVHQGETLLILADNRLPLPTAVSNLALYQIHRGEIEWMLSEVQVPDDLDLAEGWLAKLRHSVVPKPWQVSLLTPARQFVGGDPTFWLGDVVVVKVEAPTRSASTCTLVHAIDSNKYLAALTTPSSGTSFLTVPANQPGLQSLGIHRDARPPISFRIVDRPPAQIEFNALGETPRLRVWIGNACLSAWVEPQYRIHVRPLARETVRVDLGNDSVRARVAVWQLGVRRSHPGLSARETAKAVEDALYAQSVSLVEIDADNLGRIEIVPLILKVQSKREGQQVDRLAWRKYLLAQLSPRSEMNSGAAQLQHAPTQKTRARDTVDLGAVIRSRIRLRNRYEKGESSR
jgi:hypothetical protein